MARVGNRTRAPLFEEFRPAADCGCIEYAWLGHSGGEFLAARQERVSATAACGHPDLALVDEPAPPPGAPSQLTGVVLGSPRGAAAPLHDSPGVKPADRAGNMGGREWTGSLAGVAESVRKDELKPGGILLSRGRANPDNGSRVTLFDGLTDSSRTQCTAYGQTRPGTREQATPYTCWTNAPRFLPYRYRGVSAEPERSYPGAAVSRRGRSRPAIERLGRETWRRLFS